MSCVTKSDLNRDDVKLSESGPYGVMGGVVGEWDLVINDAVYVSVHTAVGYNGQDYISIY